DDKREILDGMQRLEALMSFIEQRFSIDGAYFDLDSTALTKELKDNGTLLQKTPVISREISTKFARYKFAISEYSSTSDDIDEVFRRINSSGKTLSKQELR
ncbi:GmrSD restriction endonuclease domain-containing protein, partial [Aeromonas hydrophila]